MGELCGALAFSEKCEHGGLLLLDGALPCNALGLALGCANGRGVSVAQPVKRGAVRAHKAQAVAAAALVAMKGVTSAVPSHCTWLRRLHACCAGEKKNRNS